VAGIEWTHLRHPVPRVIWDVTALLVLYECCAYVP
jgi:hypothetical protein